MLRKLIFFLIIVSLLPLSWVDAYPLVKFDFEQKYFTEPGVEVKDHCLIRVDSTYHLFYLRGNPAIDIGHATSPDLVHWELQPPVLYVESGMWDELAMWAPQVILKNSIYHMFFTGVNRRFAQQSGIAFSADLLAWSKYTSPIYHPDTSWAKWNESSWSNGRDPFVFWHEGQYYMLVTATTIANRGAIASAVSQDLMNWTDNGPLYTHTNWHVLESVQLINYSGMFHLFFTEEGINGTSHMYSSSLYGGWDINNRTVIDRGHAPEVTLFDEEYIFSRHTIYNDNHGSLTYFIVLDTLRWGDLRPYVHKPAPLASGWKLIWGNAFFFQPTFGNNPYARDGETDINHEGYCWIGTYEKFQGLLSSYSPGDFYGEEPMGVIRSNPFTITGNSMNLLVGGGFYPGICYVALVDASTGSPIYSETGRNTDRMNRRYWDLVPHKGKQVYIEIADKSRGAFGHINVDDIQESNQYLTDDQISINMKKDRVVSSDVIGGDTPLSCLHQNVPNPFNPTTTISYILAADGRIAIEIFDVSGKRVRKLVNQYQPAGTYRTLWNGNNDAGKVLSSGLYFYRLLIDGKTVDTRKMLLLR